MSREKRFARLAAAQQRIQLIAGAAAAAARQRHTEATADHDRLIRNGSGGDSSPVPPSLVHRLFDTGRRNQRIAALSAEAERTAEVVQTEKLLARQLQRIAELQIASAKVKADRKQASELLDAISAARMAWLAQASTANLKED